MTDRGSDPAIDIVDTQLHMARGKVDATLEAMDALGITSVLIDEYWGGRVDEDPTHILPGHRLANGAWRATAPTAEEASLLHPDRFAYILRIDRRDPALESVMRVAGTTPGVRAFRLQPVWTLAEAAAFAGGAYDPLLAIAGEIGLPVCLFIPGYVELLAPYARRFPTVQFVIDHCGIGFPTIPPGRPAVEACHAESPAYLDTVLALADHPNVALKWSHAQGRFGTPDYPYAGLRPLLRRAVDAFGAERVMWASDKTVSFGFTWADLLFAVREDPGLSAAEKALILGGAARRILRWPAPAAPLFPTTFPAF